MKQFILFTLLFGATFTGIAQCKGTTVKGLPCQSRMIMANGFCYPHNPDIPNCSDSTSKGVRCKIKVKKANERCTIHKMRQEKDI